MTYNVFGGTLNLALSVYLPIANLDFMNLKLQLYFNGSTTCYLEEVMMCQKICYSESRGWGARAPLHLPVGAHGR